MTTEKNSRGSARKYTTVTEVMGDLNDLSGFRKDALKEAFEDGVGLIKENMKFPHWRFNGVKETKKDVKFNFRCGMVHHRKNLKCKMNRQLIFDKNFLFSADNEWLSYKWIVQVTEGKFIWNLINIIIIL